MSTFVLPTPIGGTGGGGGDGAPGPAGKSAYQLAVQQGFEGTLEDWLGSLQGASGTDGSDGADGDDGKSVELQKTETAIQWRQEGGEFADLVTLEEITGPPGESIAVSEGDGYMDLGNIRMAWGLADTVQGPTETFAFPIEFAQPPVVQLTRLSVGDALIPASVDSDGFTIARLETYPNPIPFRWTAIGFKVAANIPVEGFDIPELPTWSAAVRAQRAGKRNARLLCIGDSTTAGHGANSSGMVANNIAQSYPTVLANLMTSRGSKSSWQSFLGSHNAASQNAFDSRISAGASWDYSVNAWTVGGTTHRSGGNTNFSFTPTEAWDTAEILFVRGDPTNGTGLTAAVNGTDFATFPAYNSTSAPQVVKPDIVTAGSVGNHTLNLRANRPNSAGYV